MKTILLTLVLLAQVTTFAAIKSQTCRSKAEIQNEIDVISTNIANVSTTRTAEGGPYKRQSYICVNDYCLVRESTNFITKYLPGHPDANAEGYVKFPDINLEKELQAMIEAQRAYERAADICPKNSDEACEYALEKKATYKFLVKKLGKAPGTDTNTLLTEIKRASTDYKELNLQCKR